MGRLHHLSKPTAARAMSQGVEIASSADPAGSQDPDQDRQAWIPTGIISQRVFSRSKSHVEPEALLCTPGDRDGRAVVPTRGGFHDKLGWEAERQESR